MSTEQTKGARRRKGCAMMVEKIEIDDNYEREELVCTNDIWRRLNSEYVVSEKDIPAPDYYGRVVCCYMLGDGRLIEVLYYHDGTLLSVALVIPYRRNRDAKKGVTV